MHPVNALFSHESSGFPQGKGTGQSGCPNAFTLSNPGRLSFLTQLACAKIGRL